METVHHLLILLFLLTIYRESHQTNVVSYSVNNTDTSTDCFENGIKVICFGRFMQTASPILNDTNSENFFTALWRKINSEEEENAKSRHKRQTRAPIRREVRAAPYERNFLRYARAVRRLKRHFGVRPDTNTYDIIAGIHTGGRSEHRGPAFLSWHRIYLLLYEAALQAVAGRGVTAPYWDSSVDHSMGSRQSRTILFSDRYFGTAVGRVTSGFFANLPGQQIVRAINGPGGLISKDGIRAVLSRRSHSEIIRYDQRRYCWECYHDGVHRWVDATMADGRTAAFDPIFWCHHAFVDYIWEIFRSRLNNAPADYPLGNTLQPSDGEMRFNDYRYQPNPPITNQEGYSNRYARLRRYAAAPSCQNDCSGSQDLYCNGNENVCVSTERIDDGRRGEGAAAAAFGAFWSSGAVMSDVAAGTTDTATTAVVLRMVKAEFNRNSPPGPPNLFPISFVDPNTRSTSVFDV